MALTTQNLRWLLNWPDLREASTACMRTPDGNVQLGAHDQAHTWVALATRRTPTDPLWNVCCLARDMPIWHHESWHTISAKLFINSTLLDSKWFPYVTYHNRPRYNSKILVDFAVHFARASKPSSNVHPSLGKRTWGSVAPTSDKDRPNGQRISLGSTPKIHETY